MDILPHDNVSELVIKFSPGGDRARIGSIPNADHFVRIPDESYIAYFIGAEGSLYRGLRGKVALWFEIAEGTHQGTRLPSYCNVKEIECGEGQRWRHPRFSVGRNSYLTQYLAELFPDRFTPDALPTTVPEQDMANRPILIKTRTSRKNHKRRRRPEPFNYSVVADVQGWAD